MFYYYSLLFILNYYGLYYCNPLRRMINLSERDYVQLIGKINSCIHANIVVVMSVLLILNMIETDTWINCLDVTRGYCLYDTLMILYYTPQDRNMIIHHLMLFFGSFSNFISIYPEQTSYALMAESTNQHLYFGWLLIKKGRSNTLIFKINAVILLLMFFVFRVLNFTYLFIFTLQNCSYYEPSSLLPIMLLNYYWFYLLGRKALNI